MDQARHHRRQRSPRWPLVPLFPSSRIPFSLLAISDRRGEPLPLEQWVTELALGGVPAFQLREKDVDSRQQITWAREIQAALENLQLSDNPRLLVNRRVDIARLSGAAGVHLPASGIPTQNLRTAFPQLLIGRSTHSLAEVELAHRSGADYVTFGPVFQTPSKSEMGSPLGLAALQEATRIGIPVLALGGIVDVSRMVEVARHGAIGIAGIRIFRSNQNFREIVRLAKKVFPS